MAKMVGDRLRMTAAWGFIGALGVAIALQPLGCGPADEVLDETVGDMLADIGPEVVLPAPLDEHEALVAADRCYFCHDAPCMTACPTDIDIPMFIRQIQTGNPLGSAKTIFDQNILGGMCARVCPTGSSSHYGASIRIHHDQSLSLSF